MVDELPWGLEVAPLGIALSNTCDLAHDKADFVILAALKPAKGVVQASNEFQNKIEGAQGNTLKKRAWDSLVNLLEDIVCNESVRRYYFLDARQALGIDPLVADFQQLISVPIEMAREKPQRAALASPDREKLVVHFAAYSSRIGVRRGDASELTTLLIHPFVAPGSL